MAGGAKLFAWKNNIKNKAMNVFWILARYMHLLG